MFLRRLAASAGRWRTTPSLTKANRAATHNTKSLSMEDGVKLRDYEYSDLIQRRIEDGESPFAFNLLLQSHLNNVLLDIQTYCQLADTLAVGEPELTRLQLLYKLYREHFQPSVLMLRHMVALGKSADRPFQERLHADMLYLHNRADPEMRRWIQSAFRENKLEDSESKLAFNQKEEASQKTDDPLEESTKEQVGEHISKDSKIKLEIAPEIIATLKQAIHSAETVVLHDVIVDLTQSANMAADNEDWLKIYQRQTIQQEAVENSEQVRLTEVELFRGVSIGRIQINRKKL